MFGDRKISTSGVLGERMSPVTGDDLTLNFCIMVLRAAGLIAISFAYIPEGFFAVDFDLYMCYHSIEA